MKNILFALLLAFAISSCGQADQKVILKGELENFSKEVVLKKLNSQGILLNEGHKIVQDEGKFELIINLEEPTYFKLGRNTLYLSPGDNMTIYCDNYSPKKSRFEGRGAEACEYLKTIPFPKMGSYLSAGQLIADYPSYEELIAEISEKVKTRQGELKGLNNVSSKFRKMEMGRINFDAANSFLCFSSYYRPRAGERQDVVSLEFAKAFRPELDKYLSDVDDKDYLDLDVYHNVYNRLLRDSNLWKMPVFSQEFLDFVSIKELISNLSNKGFLKEIQLEKEKVLSQVSEAYKHIIDKVFAEFQTLMPGKVAPALRFFDVEGKEYDLNDFKGKLVVIDVWATWCGPCCTQAPFFEELSHKFNSEKVAFISVSVDSGLDKWKSYFSKKGSEKHQYVTSRSNFDPYKVLSIPRFIVIDGDSNIIDVFAPLPSSGNLEKLIRENL